MVAEIRDGYLYGRGVIDMKGAGISHLISFIRMHRENKKLKRDLFNRNKNNIFFILIIIVSYPL